MSRPSFSGGSVWMFCTLCMIALVTVQCETDNQGGDLCPDIQECFCFDSNLQVRAECSNLQYIPDNLPRNISELMVRHSPLVNLLAGNLSLYTDLVELQLSNNEALQNIEEGALQGLANLETIKWTENNLTTLPTQIFSSTLKLKYIDLHHNQMTDLPQLPLPNLEAFIVYENQLSRVKSRSFSQCSQLNRVDMSLNEITTLEDNAFEGLSSLTILTADHNMIQILTADTLNGLSQLTTFTMRHNHIDSLPAATFFDSPDLSVVDLGENAISTINPDAFNGLEELQDLQLDKNNLTQVPSQALEKVANLRNLHIEGNPIATIAENAFSGVPYITGLFLGLSDVLTDIQNSAFHGLHNLSELSIIGSPNLANLTTDQLPVASLPNLIRLNIYGNGFIHLDESTFRDKSRLQEVNLGENPFHCSCALKWMPRVVEEKVVWAQNWKTSGTPPRCETPEILNTYKIAEMKEVDMTCDDPIVEAVSPGEQEAYLRGTAHFEAHLHYGLPASVWTAPDGKEFKPLRRPPGGSSVQEDTLLEQLKQQILAERRKAEEKVNPSDHVMIVTLDISNVSTEDAGIYHLHAYNLVGEGDITFSLYVHPFELTTPVWTHEPEPAAAMTITCHRVVLLGTLFIALSNSLQRKYIR